jgi:hypothetical protein
MWWYCFTFSFKLQSGCISSSILALLRSFIYFPNWDSQIVVKYLDYAIILPLQIYLTSHLTIILIFNILCSEIMRTSYNELQKKNENLNDSLTILLESWYMTYNI